MLSSHSPLEFVPMSLTNCVPELNVGQRWPGVTGSALRRKPLWKIQMGTKAIKRKRTKFYYLAARKKKKIPSCSKRARKEVALDNPRPESCDISILYFFNYHHCSGCIISALSVGVMMMLSKQVKENIECTLRILLKLIFSLTRT